MNKKLSNAHRQSVLCFLKWWSTSLISIIAISLINSSNNSIESYLSFTPFLPITIISGIAGLKCFIDGVNWGRCNKVDFREELDEEKEGQQKGGG